LYLLSYIYVSKSTIYAYPIRKSDSQALLYQLLAFPRPIVNHGGNAPNSSRPRTVPHGLLFWRSPVPMSLSSSLRRELPYFLTGRVRPLRPDSKQKSFLLVFSKYLRRYQTLQLLHENEHEHGVRSATISLSLFGDGFNLRKSEPCWSPAFHEESRSFIFQRSHKYFHQALSNFSKVITSRKPLTYWSFSVCRCCALQSAFQNICWCADCGCHSPRGQRRCNMDWNSIRGLYDLIRQNLLLGRRVSGVRLASTNKCGQQTYTAICETSCSSQSVFKTRMRLDSLIKMLLTTFGPNPFVKVFSPSSLPIRTNPRIAFE
jgi:hypothetical protein